MKKSEAMGAMSQAVNAIYLQIKETPKSDLDTLYRLKGVVERMNELRNSMSELTEKEFKEIMRRGIKPTKRTSTFF